MRDDVSAIPVNGCNVITATGSISNYNGNTRKDFVFNGSKWYPYRTQYSTYGDYNISGYNCIDISTLNTNSAFEPIFYGLGFALCVLTVVVFFKTIKGFLNVI